MAPELTDYVRVRHGHAFVGVKREASEQAVSILNGAMMWTLANGGADVSVAGWTDTPSEAGLLLDPRFGDVGIGVASGGTKQWWVVIYAEPGTP